jgi:hypothetical protein
MQDHANSPTKGLAENIDRETQVVSGRNGREITYEDNSIHNSWSERVEAERRLIVTA